MKDFKPSRIGRTHIVLPLVLIFAGLVAIFGASWQHTFMPAILQAVGVLCLAYSIFVVNRYSLTAFIYTIGEDSPDLLCVYRINGKKKKIDLTVDLSLAVSAVRAKDGVFPKARGVRRVSRCLNIFPEDRAIITIKSGDDVTELIIEVDDEFFAEIERHIGVHIE